MAVYYDALLGLTSPELPDERTVSPSVIGSFGAALDAYYDEPDGRKGAFCKMSPHTQEIYRRELERLRVPYGARGLKTLKADQFADMVDARKLESVSGSAQLVKALRSFGKFTVKTRLQKVNPAFGLEAVDVAPKRRREGSVEEGHLSWTVGEMLQFTRCHAPGTLPRLAFELVLGLGQRRSDAITVGPANVLGGYNPAHMVGASVKFVQVKNQKKKPV